MYRDTRNKGSIEQEGTNSYIETEQKSDINGKYSL